MRAVYVPQATKAADKISFFACTEKRNLSKVT